MRIKLYIATVVSIFGTFMVSGQTIDDESNWFKLVKGVDDYYSRLDFTRYSEDDVLAAVPIFKRIESIKAADEWEGVYSTQIFAGDAELRWRSTEGYVFHRVYHTLADLDYGSVLEDSTSVKLISGKTGKKEKSPLFADSLIKVKVGKKHYLVPESRLSDFAERAVGREVTLDEEWNYWWRAGENEFTVEGLPIFPLRYAQLVLPPIQTTILRVGRRTVVKSRSTTREVNYDDIYISVTLAGGSRKGLRPSMDFFVPELGEWVEVTKVRRFDSLGRIRRDFSLEGLEQCWDDEKGTGNPFPCKKLMKGLAAKTRPNDYF